MKPTSGSSTDRRFTLAVSIYLELGDGSVLYKPIWTLEDILTRLIPRRSRAGPQLVASPLGFGDHNYMSLRCPESRVDCLGKRSFLDCRL